MEYYLAVLIFTFVAGITPGPNNIMLLASGLNHGVRGSLPHYLGICIGFPLMVIAIGFGLGTVFIKYPYIHQGTKVVGVIYLLFLAWKIANAGNPKTSENIRAPLTFLQAAAFQWVNPKAWLIAIGAIATFTTQENMMQNIAFIVFAYLVTGFICMGFWLGLGASLARLLQHDKHRRFFNIAMAVLLVVSIVPMVVAEFGVWA